MGRAPQARRELSREHIREHFVEDSMRVQKGLCCLKGFEHVCEHVWELLQLDRV